MKRRSPLILFLFSLLALTVVAVAQTNTGTNGVPATPPGEPHLTPGVFGIVILVIPLLVPVLVTIVKSLLPHVPSWCLPILAPILGAGIDWLATFATGGTASPLLAAIAGSAGVGAREIVDQIKMKINGVEKVRVDAMTKNPVQ